MLDFLRSNSSRRKLILGFIVISTLYIFYVTVIAINSHGFGFHPLELEDPDEAGNMSCEFPKLEPFSPSVIDLIEDERFTCTSTSKEIFRIDLNSNLQQIVSPENEGWKECCYKELKSKQVVQPAIKFAPDCIPIWSKFTQIPSSYAAIAIYCQKIDEGEDPVAPGIQILLGRFPLRLVDMFPLFHPNKTQLVPAPLRRRDDKLNVVILGLDSMSHLNLIRMMPATYDFLIHNLSAVGMAGYTKVGDNTFPNLVPALSGLSADELVPVCWPAQKTTFDHCPFIWKNFSDSGYFTSLAEDLFQIGIFQYAKGGFKFPPTDDYIGPIMQQLVLHLGREEHAEFPLCFGPRFAFEILLDHMARLAEHLKKPYFQLIWATAGFHGVLHFGQSVDMRLRSFLEWSLARGHLNSTALVFMSDHGARFGKIRETKQGRIEERMPFLYYVLPEWFRAKYPKAIGNMKRNQNRLSSPFDLYETLLDLLHPENLDTLDTNDKKRRGISHFRLIPKNRTCRDAGIIDEWCVCAESKNFQSYPIDGAFVETGASALVKNINRLLSHSPECAQLGIEKVLSADAKGGTRLRLTIRTVPGSGIFEATVIRGVDSYHWRVAGHISRINLYGNQSYCVESPVLKNYCYCL